MAVYSNCHLWAILRRRSLLEALSVASPPSRDRSEGDGGIQWEIGEAKWFQIFFIFTPKIGEDEPILTSIFFRWVETTNQHGFFLRVRCGRKGPKVV